MRGVIVHIVGAIIHWSLVRAAFAMMNVIVSHGTSAIYVYSVLSIHYVAQKFQD
jgi:hypothetical protein